MATRGKDMGELECHLQINAQISKRGIFVELWMEGTHQEILHVGRVFFYKGAEADQ